MGERKNWGWFEWPGVIQTQSSGLGLYFKTMNYFLIVTFLMSIVGVGPLVANYFADEFKDTYTLVETGTEPRECDRGYEVSSTQCLCSAPELTAMIKFGALHFHPSPGFHTHTRTMH